MGFWDNFGQSAQRSMQSSGRAFLAQKAREKLMQAQQERQDKDNLVNIILRANNPATARYGQQQASSAGLGDLAEFAGERITDLEVKELSNTPVNTMQDLMSLNERYDPEVLDRARPHVQAAQQQRTMAADQARVKGAHERQSGVTRAQQAKASMINAQANMRRANEPVQVDPTKDMYQYDANGNLVRTQEARQKPGTLRASEKAEDGRWRYMDTGELVFPGIRAKRDLRTYQGKIYDVTDPEKPVLIVDMATADRMTPTQARNEYLKLTKYVTEPLTFEGTTDEDRQEALKRKREFADVLKKLAEKGNINTSARTEVDPNSTEAMSAKLDSLIEARTRRTQGTP